MNNTRLPITAPLVTGVAAALIAVPVANATGTWSTTADTTLVPQQGSTSRPITSNPPTQPGWPGQPGRPRPTSGRPTSGRPTWNPPVPTNNPTNLPPGGNRLPRPIQGGVFRDAIEITGQTHEALMDASSEKLVILNVAAENCLQCEMLAPVLRDKRGTDIDWTWGYLNALRGGNEDLLTKYGRPWLPTLITIKHGQEISRFIGFDGNRTGVLTWIDTLRAGKVPPSPESSVEVTNIEQVRHLMNESRLRPLVFRFHLEGTNDVDAVAQGKIMAAAAEEYKGAFLMAKVDATTPFGKELASNLKTVSGYNVMVAMYEGRTWQAVVPNLVGANHSEKSVRAWVASVLNANYSAGAPEDYLRLSPALSLR